LPFAAAGVSAWCSDACCTSLAVNLCLLSDASCTCLSQPKEIQEIKDFLLTARRKDARCACPSGKENALLIAPTRILALVLAR